MTVKMFAPVSAEVHEKLTEIAASRRMPLYLLTKAILEWAGDKNVQDFIRLGINIPVYPSELRSGDSEDNR